MPTSNNIIGACQLYYAGFGFTPKPAELWFDGVPIKRTNGTVINLPTVEILHRGATPFITEEGVCFDQHDIVFEVRAVTLAAAAAIAKGMKYNGGTPMQFLGFDGASPDNSGIAFPLDPGQVLKSMIRQREQYFRETARDPNSDPVHRIELAYLANVMVTA